MTKLQMLLEMKNNLFALVAFLILALTACGPTMTLMPTAVPPDKATTVFAQATSQAGTTQHKRNLPPTWTPTPTLLPPTPTKTPVPVSFVDLESILMQLDFQTGVVGVIQRSMPDYGVADFLYDSADIAIFQEIDELEGFIAVANYHSDSFSEKIYQDITNWMYEISLADYGDYVYTRSHNVSIGQAGYALEFYIPTQKNLRYPGGMTGTWNVPEGETIWIPLPVNGGQAPSRVPASYTSCLVSSRCNTLIFIWLEAPLTQVRSYAQKLDAKLYSLICR